MKSYKALYVIGILLFSAFTLSAQVISTRDSYIYNIQPIKAPIKIDGIEDAGEWSNFQLIDTMYNHNPSDKGLAAYQSEIRLTYDNDNLYLFAKHYDDGDRIIQSLQRDSDNSQWESDSFTIAIDPINKKQSGVMIGVNAGGAKVDGSLLVEPGRTTYTDSWDTSWVSATKQYDTYWILEIAIPFNSLRYNADNTEWGINFIRGHKTRNFYYTWTPFPINFNGIDVNYMGTLKWPEVPEVKNNIAFVKPFTTISSIKDNQSEYTDAKTKADAGIDVKIGITKSLNADVTFNPDFSNADVDQEITNITRFDISLPEQREFFLENADIFTNFGSYSINPFFSRRVGLTMPIVYGARVTGNITDDLRIGVMNVQTKEDTDFDAQNNTVAAFSYKVLDRSQFRGLFVNRQEIGNDSIHDYARNYGAEFTYISKKGNFNNSIKYHGSITNEGTEGEYFGIDGHYSTRRLRTGLTLDIMDKDYNADLGFTPRLFNYNADTQSVVRRGYIFVNPYITYKWFPKKEFTKLNFQGFRFNNNFYLNSDGSLNERDNSMAYDIFFKNTSLFTVLATNTEVNLVFATNFLGSEFDNLPVGNYNFTTGTVSYTSDRRKVFTYNTSITHGGFYNGKITTLVASTNLRFGYWANFNVAYNYNNINFPDQYSDIDLHLLRFRGLFSFTNKLFFNNTIQYNSQSENFSMFSRLQWRYAPLSDLFLIYNQNNDAEGFDLRNKSIILKLTHRFAV